MKLPTRLIGGPRRGLPLTAGSVSGLTRLILAIAPSARVSGEMSGTTSERSRMTPVLSRRPGFSRPGRP